MICGIGLPWTDTCTHPAGHLGRCSWDDRRVVDPRHYDRDGSVNLLDPRQVDGDEPAPRSVFMTARYHGTHSGYVAGCRCELCAAANTEYMREYRAAAREQTPPRDDRAVVPESPAPAGHGTNTRYTRGKCHCSWCTAAHAEYMRGYRARSVDSSA